ncbi:hypothetical protein AB0D04_16425 [Streptomyces sp. NPDC048483]|uniref:hypothetical protein n=1 Tax=Streptomyces sp. NPDC048483 TaxID=3154927 RepID=UPI00344221C3
MTGGLTKGGAATAGVAAVGLLLAGCSPGGDGVRTEGTPSSTPGPKGTLTASPAPRSTANHKKVDVVKLLKSSPEVGAEVKKSLAEPCSEDAYPVDWSHASLTGSTSTDIVVNVMACADSVGIGAYVFRERGGADDGYEIVYHNEQPTVSAGADEGELEVSTQTYDADDQVCCPSGEDVLRYRWSGPGHGFTPHGPKHHTDYSETTVDRTKIDDGTATEG